MGTTCIPVGSDASTCRNRAFTRAMTSSAFSPSRMTTMPETASPVPLKSVEPLRNSEPMATVATSLTRTGVPLSEDAISVRSMSAVDRA